MAAFVLAAYIYCLYTWLLIGKVANKKLTIYILYDLLIN